MIMVFDVGGSHIAAALFCPDSTELGPLRRVPAPVDGVPDKFFESFKSLAHETLGTSDAIVGIAIAMPNPFDYEHGVSYMRHKYHLLYGTDLKQGLSKYLKCEPHRIHFLNDAAAFLIGELYDGAGRGVSRAAGITLGTGVGSAFAVDDKIVVNGAGVPPAGEIWNLPYGDGIVEDAISTRAIQSRYEQLTGTRAEVRDIALLGSGHPDAQKTFAGFGRELGRVLRRTCLAFAPERVIIGGGISQAASLFQRATQEELGDFRVELSVSELLDSAPLIGAGISWMQRNTPEKVALRHGFGGVASR
ncbi:MAG TPA: ROK family protein [Terriglobales bacterium]|nr:ROK family protein [Terriglobales bacterium]